LYLHINPAPCLKDATAEEHDRGEADHVLEGVLQLSQQRSFRVRHLPAARGFISRISKTDSTQAE
jgi:hypothetical protein